MERNVHILERLIFVYGLLLFQGRKQSKRLLSMISCSARINEKLLSYSMLRTRHTDINIDIFVVFRAIFGTA